jgi:hypothetical protein
LIEDAKEIEEGKDVEDRRKNLLAANHCKWDVPILYFLISLYFLYLHSTRGNTHAGDNLKIAASIAERGPTR